MSAVPVVDAAAMGLPERPSIAALLDRTPEMDGSATEVETLNLLFDLLWVFRPRVIIEAGTYQGHFTVGAARLLPESRIYTFDPVLHGKWPDEHENIIFCKHDFNYIPEPFQFAFIDSGPPFSGPWEDGVRWRHWQLACANIDPMGVVACHDTNHTDWEGRDAIVAQSQIRWTEGQGLAAWQRLA